MRPIRRTQVTDDNAREAFKPPDHTDDDQDPTSKRRRQEWTEMLQKIL